MRLVRDFAAIALLWPCIAFSGTYDAEYLSAYDGDTVRLKIDVWPGMVWEGNVRLNKVDTPEYGWRAKCVEEKRLATFARSHTIHLLESAERIRVTIDRFGSRGRPLALISVDGLDLSQSLIDAEYARPYHGGKRQSWCDR